MNVYELCSGGKKWMKSECSLCLSNHQNALRAEALCQEPILPLFPASAQCPVFPGEGSQRSLHPCQALGWSNWARLLHGTVPLSSFLMVRFNFEMHIFNHTQSGPWMMLTMWLILMWLSRAEGKSRLAELLPPPPPTTPHILGQL